MSNEPTTGDLLKTALDNIRNAEHMWDKEAYRASSQSLATIAIAETLYAMAEQGRVRPPENLGDIDPDASWDWQIKVLQVQLAETNRRVAALDETVASLVRISLGEQAEEEEPVWCPACGAGMEWEESIGGFVCKDKVNCSLSYIEFNVWVSRDDAAAIVRRMGKHGGETR